MFERHRKLRGALNRSLSPVTRHIPPEIMSSIFQLCLPIELEKKLGSENNDIEVSVPLVLGAVCQTWRSIAWSTPQLWNQIYIPISLMTLSRRNEITQQWLSRSGDLPLKVCAEYVDELNYNDAIAIDMLNHDVHLFIVDTINRYASRWGEMFLVLPTFLLSAIQAKSGAPHLRKVVLKTICSDFNYPPEDEAPAWENGIWLTRDAEPRDVLLDFRLYSNVLNRVRLNALKFNWKSMTRLELLYLDSELCLDILKQASGLTYFIMESFDNGNHIIPSSDFIVHPNIRFFKYIPLRTVRPLPLRLPALVELHCKASWHCHTPLITWFDPAFNHSASLEKLFLDITQTKDVFLDILQKARSIQHLHLTTSRHTQLLKRLGVTSLPFKSDSTKSLSFLPNLQSLTCVLIEETVPWNDIPDIFGSLAEIDNPLRRPLMSLKVFQDISQHPYIIPGSRDYDNCMSSLPKIIELKRAGIDIEIRHQRTNTDMLKAAIEHLNITSS